MAYVYSHHKKTSGEIFYIGISNISDGKYSRAIDYNKRSRIWKSIVKKHGFTYKIIQEGLTWEEAIELEIKLIAKYGRIHNKSGVLCNLTIGGEGCTGFPITDEYRKKCSDAQKGKIGLFGKDNPFYGRKHTKESMLKKSETTKKNGKMKGENNPNFGKPLPEYRREQQRQFMLGQTLSEETKVKIRAWGKGRPKPLEWRESRKGKGNQNFIDFASIDDIKVLYLDKELSTTKIGEIYNVSGNTVYKRLIDNGIQIRGQGKRIISVVCLNDGKVFKSMSEASSYYNIGMSSLYQVLKGNYKQIKGLKFEKHGK